MVADGAIRPASDDDITFGIPSGFVADALRVPTARSSAGASPLEALLHVVGDVATGENCFVGFSGGCDSSLVLAACTRSRRERGLSDPVPVTLRYDDPETHEAAYQAAMIAHLQLRDHLVIDVAGRQDLLGEAARSSLVERGVFWPATTHASGWLWEMLGPGTYLTGEGGDEVFGPRRSTALAEVLRYVVRGHRFPTRRVSRGARAAISPKGRRARDQRDLILEGYGAEWIEPGERDRLVQLAVVGQCAEPLRPRAWLDQHLARRRVAIGIANVRAHAASYGIAWQAPLLAPRFLGALVDHVKWHEYRGRPIILRHHFSDLLPPLLLDRTTKATFNAAFFGADTRAFASRWDGTGLSPAVDAEWLRSNWLSDAPHAGTGMLLQAAWLASRAATVPDKDVPDDDMVAAARGGT